VLDEDAARSLADALAGRPFSVEKVDEKPYTRRPAAPFRTSTLQQEASRKLRFSSQTTMRVAQRLYENGHITYMRTDSVTLSDSALTAARAHAARVYGPETVPAEPRRYERAVANAQEAHEAIRPAGDVFRTPDELRGELSRDEHALYDLIFKRTVASQMKDASGQTVSIELAAMTTDDRAATFRASGTVITFRLLEGDRGRDEPTETRSAGCRPDGRPDFQADARAMLEDESSLHGSELVRASRIGATVDAPRSREHLTARLRSQKGTASAFALRCSSFGAQTSWSTTLPPQGSTSDRSHGDEERVTGRRSRANTVPFIDHLQGTTS
jgi:DNA topoisomerase-1